MSSFSTIKYDKIDNIADICLNRPEVLNAYNTQMRDEIYQIIGAAEEDSEVKALIIRGEGDRAFCSGADLTEFGTAPSMAIARQVRWERDVWGLLWAIEKPVIAALHGYVIGSGLEMALLCDFRIATNDCTFRLPEANLGMLPAAGGSQTLSRIAGVPIASSMLLAGYAMNSEEAISSGLVHKIVSGDNIMDESIELASKLANYPDRSMRAMKHAIRKGIDLPLESGLDLELNLAVACNGE